MGKVLSAQGSGYFTTCIQDGTGYWSLEKAMEVVWRVRSWQVNMSATYFVSDGENEQTFTTNFGTPTQLTSGLDIGREEELVCGYNSFYSTNIFINFTGATKSGSLYNPGFSFYALVGVELDVGLTYVQVDSGNFGNDIKSYSIYGSAPIEFSYSTGQFLVTEFLDASLSLEPVEWWSYGGTYNTSTGARL